MPQIIMVGRDLHDRRMVLRSCVGSSESRDRPFAGNSPSPRSLRRKPEFSDESELRPLTQSPPEERKATIYFLRIGP